MIISKHITYSPTCLMISIAIDNGRNNTVGEGCYSAHQAVSKFAEHNIDMVSCVHRKSGKVMPGILCISIEVMTGIPSIYN